MNSKTKIPHRLNKWALSQISVINYIRLRLISEPRWEPPILEHPISDWRNRSLILCWIKFWTNSNIRCPNLWHIVLPRLIQNFLYSLSLIWICPTGLHCKYSIYVPIGLQKCPRSSCYFPVYISMFLPLFMSMYVSILMFYIMDMDIYTYRHGHEHRPQTWTWIRTRA